MATSNHGGNSRFAPTLLRFAIVASVVLHLPPLFLQPSIQPILAKLAPRTFGGALERRGAQSSEIRGPDGLYGKAWRTIDEYVCETSFSGVTVVSRQPLIIVIENFLRTGEAEHFKNKSQLSLDRSTVVVEEATDTDYEERRRRDEARTSSSAFLERHGDPVIQCIEMRAVEFSGVPLDNTESLQVVHYTEGQRYMHHYDWFPDSYLATEKRGGQRVTTFFVYLSTLDPALGGATNFPKASKHVKGRTPAEPNGVDVFPKKGRAVFWYDTLENGQGDERTLHAGMAPTGKNVEKWGLNIWQREGEFV